MQKNLLIIIIAIILIAIIAGGVVYFWQSASFAKEKQQLQQMIQNLQNQITQLQNQINKPADPTVDWQTYRNAKYGFEIQYPKNWQAEILSSSAQSAVFGIPNSTKSELFQYLLNKQLSFNAEAGSEGNVNIRILTTLEPEQTINKYYEQTIQSTAYQKKDITIGGQKAVKYYDFGTGPAYFELILVTKDNKEWAFIIYHLLDTEIEIKEIDQILSTFKFIE